MGINNKLNKSMFFKQIVFFKSAYDPFAYLNRKKKYYLCLVLDIYTGKVMVMF